MANKEHLEILKQGVEAWNKWRQENPSIKPNLEEAHLKRLVFRGADLHEANLSAANLHRAVLTESNLKGALLSRTILTEANLQRADCSIAWIQKEVDHKRPDFAALELGGFTFVPWSTNLRDADLRDAKLNEAILTDVRLDRANLTGANLCEVDLRGASLSGVCMHNVSIERTILDGVDLSVVKGLDQVHHAGPSTIGIDTIYRSKGNIPESFLRGAGLPDTFIEFAKSLAHAEQPIEYYSCFISYSSADDDLAQRLYNDLQGAGVRCWFAPHDMKIGAKIRPTLDETIRLHEKALLLLSESSVNSQWVEQEVETALAEERRTGRTLLFPIRLDDAVMEVEGGWPALVKRTRNIGDFTQWKDHDAYQQAFERLLRDLKAEN